MSRKSQQKSFDLDQAFQSKIGKPFGGGRLKGHPKTKRPFSKKHLIHVIFKSSKAKGNNSFLHPRNVKMINRLVRNLSKRCDIEIKEYANVGNHLHLLIKASHRNFMIKYLRTLAALIPRKLLNCEKGRELGFAFWDSRPFSRIVADGKKSFLAIKHYIEKNKRQAMDRTPGFNPVVEIGTSP